VSWNTSINGYTDYTVPLPFSFTFTQLARHTRDAVSGCVTGPHRCVLINVSKGPITIVIWLRFRSD